MAGPESGHEHDQESDEQKELDQPAPLYEEDQGELGEHVEPGPGEFGASFDIQCDNSGHKVKIEFKTKKASAEGRFYSNDTRK